MAYDYEDAIEYDTYPDFYWARETYVKTKVYMRQLKKELTPPLINWEK